MHLHFQLVLDPEQPVGHEFEIKGQDMTVSNLAMMAGL